MLRIQLITIQNWIRRQDLADDIEHGYYSRGKQEELVAEIKKLDPNAGIIWGSISKLEKQLEEFKFVNQDG